MAGVERREEGTIVRRASWRGPVDPAVVRALRAARWAEGVYAALAFFYWIEIPIPPGHGQLVPWVFWLGMTVLCGMLAWRLGRPDRATWIVAALACAFVLLSLPLSLGTVGVATDAFRRTRAPALLVGLGLLAIGWGAQLVVAIGLYRTRGRMPRA